MTQLEVFENDQECQKGMQVALINLWIEASF